MDTTSEIKTFRGRTLEEVLPQIREELGPDAIVLRRREGLAGGVGGFFQRSFVEVEARRPLPDEQPLEARNDRATAEGLATPGIQALVEQAAPFADALDGGRRARDRGARAGRPRRSPPASTARSRTSSRIPRSRRAPAVAEQAPAPVRRGAAGRRGRAGRPRRRWPSRPCPSRPRAAADARGELVAAGLSARLAADVVGEAVTHGLPFAAPRQLKKLVRSALARRIPVLADLGPGSPPDRLRRRRRRRQDRRDRQARPRLRAGRPRGRRRRAALARRRLRPRRRARAARRQRDRRRRRRAGRAPARRREPLLTLIDTPAAGPGDAPASPRSPPSCTRSARTEVHLTLPATLSAAAADELSGALAPLGITHVALTHADQTARPGAPLELAIRARKPALLRLDREAAEPADAAALAQRLLP